MLDNTHPPGTPYHNYRAVLEARAMARERGLHHTLRHLFEVIAGYTNGKPAWPSYETLADITGLSPVTVRERIRALVEQGYLTQTRRRTRLGGWGQPEWCLGSTCPQVEVVPGQHSTPLQVMPRQQSSDAPPSLASDAPPSQKRDSVDHGDSVVPEKTMEEKDPPTPLRPASKEEQLARSPTEHERTVGNARVQAFIDGLRAGGGKHRLEGALTPRDFKFIKEGDFDARDLGACYRATDDGAWPGADQYIKDRFSLHNVFTHRYAQWLTRHTPTAPPAPNGKPSRVDSMRDLMDEMRSKEATAHDVRPVRRALPAAPDPLRAPPGG